MNLGRVFILGLLGLTWGVGACEREPQADSRKIETTPSPKPSVELVAEAVKAHLEYTARGSSWGADEFLVARNTAKEFRLTFEPLKLTAADGVNGLSEPCWLVYVNYACQYAPGGEWQDGYFSLEAVRTSKGGWLVRTPYEQYKNGSWEPR